MKDCFYQYRKGLYEVLSTITYGGSAVPVMEYAPAEQATPYIQIMGMSSTLVRDDDVFSQEVVTDIQVVTSYKGDPGEFGSLQSDTIMNSVMELLITRGVTVEDRAAHILMDDFIDFGCWFQALNYQNYFDGNKIYIIKVLTIRTMIDEFVT